MSEDPNPSSAAARLLADEIETKLNYFRQEFDITYIEVIGVLEVIKHGLCGEVWEEDE